MEILNQFTDRLSIAVGCYWHKNKDTNSLDKYPAKPRLTRTGNTFGWVARRVRRGAFRVSTYEYLADTQGRLDADFRKEGAHYISKEQDYGQATGIYYFVKYDSIGQDFRNTVRALKIIMNNR